MSLLLLFKTDNAAKSMSAAGGAFALTGEASNLNEFHFVLASKGAFALSGGAATFSRTCLLTTTSGAFSLTGSLATAALVGPVVTFGTFGFSGSDAALVYVATAPNSYSLSANSGAFALYGGGAGVLVAVTEVGTAKFSWRSQALVGIVAQPAHASFNWKV